MKFIALFAIAFLVSCASSSTDIIDSRSLQCGPGQDIDIMAGMDKSSVENRMDDRVQLLVNVSNNSHQELTVMSIRAEQVRTDETRVLIDAGTRQFNQVLPEGKEHTFELPLFARLRELTERDRLRERENRDRGIEMVVTVQLSNGDSYRCAFDVGPIR